MARAIDTIVFDVGNVLIGWDPRNLYRRVFNDTERMEWFLTHVCSPEWNARLDLGRPWQEGIDELVGRFPGLAAEIRAYRERWHEMVPGPMPGMPELFAALGKAGLRRYAVTNFSLPTFEECKLRFPFLAELDGAAVSGALRICKPDPAIFRWLIDEHHVTPMRSVYVDDSPANVAAANDLGFNAVLFQGAEQFADQLAEFGVGLKPLDDAA
jgi:2-haloacid dehalogenase